MRSECSMLKLRHNVSLLPSKNILYVSVIPFLAVLLITLCTFVYLSSL